MLRVDSTKSLLTFSCVLFLCTSDLVSAAELTAEKSEQGVTIKIDSKRFAEYVTKSNTKPIVYPIYGPTDKKMMRDYPLVEKVPGESSDHPHHRSLWFTHGEVNGIDFWTEVGGKKGSIVHREFGTVAGGKEATVVTKNDWMSPDNKRVCADERTLVFGGNDDVRWIDFAIKITATDGPVEFGDTKEGSFGVRVPDAWTMPEKKGADAKKTEPKMTGMIVTSEGKTNAAAWGQPAAWVDYYGPIEGETLGIAILNHPSSFRYPTCWHVRTYGLFAANPFGKKDFKVEGQGAYHLPAGESVAFRYRVVLHKGDEKAGKIAEAFADYSKAK